MSLAGGIERLIYSSTRISKKTINQGIREIIDSYVKDYGKKVPLLEKVVKGETTFCDEFKRLGPEEFMKDYNLVAYILHGNFDVEEQLKTMDKHIKRLYWRK